MRREHSRRFFKCCRAYVLSKVRVADRENKDSSDISQMHVKKNFTWFFLLLMKFK